MLNARVKQSRTFSEQTIGFHKLIKQALLIKESNYELTCCHKALESTNTFRFPSLTLAKVRNPKYPTRFFTLLNLVRNFYDCHPRGKSSC